MREESERREEIQDRVESLRPSIGHAAHVALRIAKIRPLPALARHIEQLLRIVEAIHIVAGLRKQVSVPALPARYIEYARANRKREQLDETRYFLAVALGREEKTVLTEIVGVEGRLPPLTRFCQKKTGSRYAPKTASIAARIS
jgi:hypothetical protein